MAISQLSRRAAEGELRRLFLPDLARDGRLSHAKAAELPEISLAESAAFVARHRTEDDLRVKLTRRR